MDVVVQQNIDRLEKLALICEEQGKFLESIDYLERAYLYKRQVFDATSPQISQAYESVVTKYNVLGMKFLSEDNYSLALDMLRKADALTRQTGVVGSDALRLKLRAVTLNNYGCYYKRMGKPLTALQYVDDALRIEISVGGADSPATTHLNMCAILSALGRHESAIQHAQCALRLLVENGPVRDESTLLPIAYHSLGVEQQALGMLHDAASTFELAYSTAVRNLGEDNSLTLSMRAAWQTAAQATAPAARKKKGSKTTTGKAKTGKGASKSKKAHVQQYLRSITRPPLALYGAPQATSPTDRQSASMDVRSAAAVLPAAILPSAGAQAQGARRPPSAMRSRPSTASLPVPGQHFPRPYMGDSAQGPGELSDRYARPSSALPFGRQQPPQPQQQMPLAVPPPPADDTFAVRPQRRSLSGGGGGGGGGARPSSATSLPMHRISYDTAGVLNQPPPPMPHHSHYALQSASAALPVPRLMLSRPQSAQPSLASPRAPHSHSVGVGDQRPLYAEDLAEPAAESQRAHTVRPPRPPPQRPLSARTGPTYEQMQVYPVPLTRTALQSMRGQSGGGGGVSGDIHLSDAARLAVSARIQQSIDLLHRNMAAPPPPAPRSDTPSPALSVGAESRPAAAGDALAPPVAAPAPAAGHMNTAPSEAGPGGDLVTATSDQETLSPRSPAVVALTSTSPSSMSSDGGSDRMGHRDAHNAALRAQQQADAEAYAALDSLLRMQQEQMQQLQLAQQTALEAARLSPSRARQLQLQALQRQQAALLASFEDQIQLLRSTGPEDDTQAPAQGHGGDSEEYADDFHVDDDRMVAVSARYGSGESLVNRHPSAHVHFDSSTMYQ